MPSNRAKTLVISLVTFNGERHLAQCLESVRRQTFQDSSLVVFDNASTDRTIDLVKQYAPHARIIASPTNVGFARAHNEVIRATNSRYVMVLNQDVYLEPDYCEKLISLLETNPQSADVTGLLVRAEELTKREESATVDCRGLFLHKGYFVRCNGEGEALSRISTKIAREVFGVSATGSIYRRYALDDVALGRGERREVFDEEYFMYKEDVDLSYRLRWRGWQSFCLDDARAFHVRSKRKESRDSEFINLLSYRNNLFTEFKNISGGLFLRVGFFLFLFEFLKLIYLLCREPKTLRGLPEFFRHFSAMKLKRAEILSRRICTNGELFQWYTRV